MVSVNTEQQKVSRSLLKLVLQQVKPYRKWLLIIFIAMLIETLMGLASPWPLKIIIDNVIGGRHFPNWLHSITHADNKMALAATAAILLVILTITGAVAGYINNYYTENVAQHVANDVRLQVYHHLQRLSLSYYDTHQVGKILSTITTDVLIIQEFVSTALLSIFIDIMMIAGILLLMFYLNWDFALVAISVTPFILFFFIHFKKAVKKSMHEVRVDQSNMVAVLQQGLESIRVVNAFNSQDAEEERLKKVSLETVNASLRTRKLKSILSPVVTVTVTLCIAWVLWRGTALVLAGVMTVGALTVFLAYLTKFFNPVKDLAKMTNTIAQATVALERIRQILDTDSSIIQKAGATYPADLKGEIIFDSVSFAYDPATPVLKNLSLKINAGQRIGICGPTGGGKSTIACLIARFYDPLAGRVLIDGTDVRDYTLDGLRKQIGFVLQDTVLFYGSVKENIAYGKPNATEKEIIEAARLANAEEFITRMSNGYDTMIGERGVTLSGGQRQRIGIARAIIRNAPILVLDEPTASLDMGSEKIVMDALERLMKGRTVITIAHRLSTICAADKIIVIKDGCIAEEGTHQQLIREGKIYYGLYRMQPGINVLSGAG